MIEARNNGIPLIEQSPKASVTQSIMSLAASLLGNDAAAPPKAPVKKSGLGGLFKLWPRS